MDVNENLRDRLLEINSLKGGARRKKKTKKAKSCPIVKFKRPAYSYRLVKKEDRDDIDKPCGRKKRVCRMKTNKKTTARFKNRLGGPVIATHVYPKNTCLQYKNCKPSIKQKIKSNLEKIKQLQKQLDEVETCGAGMYGGARRKRRCILKTKKGKCKKYTTSSCKKMPLRLKNAVAGTKAMKEKMGFLRSCRKK